MALIQPLKGFTPKIGKDCFLAENAVLVGDVEIGDESSVWYHAVLRGDVNSIKVGNRSNIQDLAMIHCTYEETKTIIGDDVTIGHSAIVHGATIHNNVLIGMGAIVMDNVVVEENVVVGAGSLVLEGMRLESGWLYAGSPVRQIKKLSPEHIENVKYAADHYVLYGGWYKEEQDNRKG